MKTKHSYKTKDKLDKVFNERVNVVNESVLSKAKLDKLIAIADRQEFIHNRDIKGMHASHQGKAAGFEMAKFLKFSIEDQDELLKIIPEWKGNSMEIYFLKVPIGESIPPIDIPLKDSAITIDSLVLSDKSEIILDKKTYKQSKGDLHTFTLDYPHNVPKSTFEQLFLVSFMF